MKTQNKKQTALEFLIKEFSEILGPLDTKPMQDLLIMDAIKNAKEMENREIRFDIEEKWKQFRSITNNEDAWLFKEWLIEQTYGSDK